MLWPNLVKVRRWEVDKVRIASAYNESLCQTVKVLTTRHANKIISLVLRTKCHH